MVNPVFSGLYNLHYNRAWTRDTGVGVRYNPTNQPSWVTTACSINPWKPTDFDFNWWAFDSETVNDFPSKAFVTILSDTSATPFVEDTVNTVGWVQQIGGSTLGQTRVWSVPNMDENRIYESDIRYTRETLNSVTGNYEPYSMRTGPDAAPCSPGTIQFDTVAGHEIGHFYGFGHMFNAGGGTDSNGNSWEPWMGGGNTAQIMHWSVSQSSPTSASEGEQIGWGVLYYPPVTAIPNDLAADASVGPDPIDWAVADFDGPILDDRFAAINWESGADTVTYLKVNTQCVGSTSTDCARRLATIEDTGSEVGGIGLAVGRVNTGNLLDAVVIWADAPAGDNSLYYRVVWDLTPITTPLGGFVLSPKKSISGGIGWETQGVGACLTNFNGGAQDLVIAWIDDAVGGNSIKYRIGWGLNSQGDASWSDTFTIGGGTIGDTTPGLAVSCGDFDFDGGLDDVVFAWMDDPVDKNSIRYRAGYNFGSGGAASGWGDTHYGPRRRNLEHDAMGMGIGHGDFDGTGQPDLEFIYTVPDGGMGETMRLIQRESRIESS